MDGVCRFGVPGVRLLLVLVSLSVFFFLFEINNGLVLMSLLLLIPPGGFIEVRDTIPSPFDE